MASVSYIEQPTNQLRFLDGVLQQYWSIETREGGRIMGLHGEWRDVPAVHTKEGQ